MLELDGVEATFGDFRLDAAFTVGPGERVAVMGASGSGKSTLLALVAGFLRPDRGRILWQGRDLVPLPPQARPVAIIFQENNVFPHLTAAQNVALGLRPSARLSPGERTSVEAALERVGLGGMGARRPAALSGGQQSRVALARLALQSRPLILLDEPFAALGPALRVEMLDLVADIAGGAGATLLMVTHDPADARRIAQGIALIDAGQVTPPVPTAALLADPPPALRAYLGTSR